MPLVPGEGTRDKGSPGLGQGTGGTGAARASTLRFPSGTGGAGPWWILAGVESRPGNSLFREPGSVSWAGIDCGGRPQSQACPSAVVLHILAPLHSLCPLFLSASDQRATL